MQCRSAPELTFNIRNREPKPPSHILRYPHPLLHQQSYKQLFAMQCLQGSGFWAVLLLHKRYRYLKPRATYTRTRCKLKITPPIALTRLSCSHSCMHNLNAATLQERGRVRALCSSTHLHTANMGRRNKWHPALYCCLLTFTGVSSAVATLLQVAEEKHYPLLKEFFSNLLLFWLAQTSRRLWEFGSSREFASYTLLAQPIQPSKSCNNSSFPHNLFSQTFSHIKALLGSLRMFITLLRHSSVVLPKCLPNVWLLKKHGCL